MNLSQQHTTPLSTFRTAKGKYVFTCGKRLMYQWRTSTAKFLLVVWRQRTALQQQLLCMWVTLAFWHHLQFVYLMQKLVRMEVPLFFVGKWKSNPPKWTMKSYRGAGVFDLRKADDTHLHSIHFWSDQRKEELRKIEFVIIIIWRGWPLSYFF